MQPEALILQLTEALNRWLPEQPEWAGVSPTSISVIAVEPLNEDWPVLLWVPVQFDVGSEHCASQVIVALAPTLPTAVPIRSLIATLRDPHQQLVAYDAFSDPHTAIRLLTLIDGSDRPATGLDAHVVVRQYEEWSSVVFGDRCELLIVKSLDPDNDAAFDRLNQLHTANKALCAKVHPWYHGDVLIGGVRKLNGRPRTATDVARTSLAEVLHRQIPPSEPSVDLFATVSHIGQLLARTHIALAKTHPAQKLDGPSLVDGLRTRLAASSVGDDGRMVLEQSYDRLTHGTDLGMSISVLGDLDLDHLAVTGGGAVAAGSASPRAGEWTLARMPTGIPRVGSPLSDVAALIQSLRRLSESMLNDFTESSDDPGDSDVEDGPRPLDPPQRQMALLAESWFERAGDALVQGYLEVSGVEDLLPQDGRSRDALLAIFDADQAVFTASRAFIRSGSS